MTKAVGVIVTSRMCEGGAEGLRVRVSSKGAKPTNPHAQP